MYRPDTGYTALYRCLYSNDQYTAFLQLTRPQPFNSVDSRAGRQLVSTRYGFNQLVTESTDRPHSLLQINWPITNQHQESPTQRSSTSCALLISSLFTGLRLMTGLIMYSPWQEVFSYTETASTGYRAHQPVTGYTVFTEQFCFTPAGYRVYRLAIRCNYCLAPFQYWFQRTGTKA